LNGRMVVKKWKWWRRQWSWPVQAIVSAFAWSGWEKPQKTWQDRWYQCWNLNLESPKYKAGVLTTQLQHLVAVRSFCSVPTV